MSCLRTQHGDPNWARTPTSGSRVRDVNHQATAPPTANSASRFIKCAKQTIWERVLAIWKSVTCFFNIHDVSIVFVHYVLSL